jgi:hypothetical protein
LVKGKDNSFIYEINPRRQTVTVRPSPDQINATYKGVFSRASPADLARWAQENGYTGWFGVSDKARQALRHALRKFLRRSLNKARKK